MSSELEYQETTPGRWFRDYCDQRRAEPRVELRRRPPDVGRSDRSVSVTLPNFWEAELNTSYEFRRQDMRLTRGGPSMQRPRVVVHHAEVETREGAQTQGNLENGRTAATRTAA